jgi:pimeloyl-ACP methyl ester carboxylesterase
LLARQTIGCENGRAFEDFVRSFYVSANSVRLHVTDWGGEGSGLFFAHPTGFLGAIWRPVIDALRRRGFSRRVLTFDQRGHGLSSKPDRGYEWSIFVSDVTALVRSLEIEGYVGVGHSAGGTTLACVAAHEPNRFRRLVLIDPILIDGDVSGTPSGRRNPMAAKTRTRRLVWSSREELYASFRDRSPYDTWTAESLETYVNEGTFERPDGEIELFCPGRIEAQVYEHAAGMNGFACLRSLALPILIVRGEHSDSFDVARAEKAARLAPESRAVTIPNATHYIPMEKPEVVAELILAEFAA